jgi:hypothetical protein
MATCGSLNYWAIESGASHRIGVVTEFSLGPAQTIGPLNITAGPDGNLWFTSRTGGSAVANIIGRITPTGEITRFSVPYTGTGGDITAAPTAISGLRPRRTNRSGESRRRAKLPSSTRACFHIRWASSAVPDGNLWFAEQGNRIGRITPIPTVIEFYNATLDHYFMTWMPNEIVKLDAGTEPAGWQRTGHSFIAFTNPPAGVVPVCRYYIPPELGDSHFYGRRRY